MSAKRKAAADVFVEQNVMQQAEYDKPDLALNLEDQRQAPPAQNQAMFAPSPGVPMTGMAVGGGMPLPPPQAPPPPRMRAPLGSGLKTSEELQLEKEPIRVREVGVWPFKRVIVPPYVYVVHTRLGRKEPVTIGLGISFPYNPQTDAYLVVPAAMQTIGIVANSISKEKQGINILAYVQWQIQDFAVAYRRLDFSDARDPLGIVNAQLREQAEAAIKDKIATMTVEEVLTDKEPVIEELTARLKAVAEGRGQGEGLGIKIVTVQIKEALVSSQRLWENLQAPFRYEKEKTARVSYLAAQEEIRQRELQTRKLNETSEAKVMVEIEHTKQTKETEALQLRLDQEATRLKRAQEAAQHRIQQEEQTTRVQRESQQRLKLEAAQLEQAAQLAALARAQEAQLEQAKLLAATAVREKQLEVERVLQTLAEEGRLAAEQLQADQRQLERDTARKQAQMAFTFYAQEQDQLVQLRALEASLARTKQDKLAQLELDDAANRTRAAQAEREAALERQRQETRNLIGERDLAARMVERLPELAAHMPEVHELKVLQTGSDAGAFDALTVFLTKVVALAEQLGVSVRPRPPAT